MAQGMARIFTFICFLCIGLSTQVIAEDAVEDAIPKEVQKESVNQDAAPAVSVSTSDVLKEKTPSEPSQRFHLKDDPAAGQSARDSKNAMTMLLGLLAVLGLIAGLAWLSKRYNFNLPGASSNMKLVSAMSVGSKEKIILVDVEGSRLLLGVTPHQVNLIQSFGGVEPSEVDNDFSGRMQKLLKKGVNHES